MANRVTKVAVEVLVLPTTQQARVTKVAVEGLVLPTSQLARVTQVAVEVLVHPPVGRAASFTADAVFRAFRTSSFTADAVLTPPPNVRVTQVAIEALTRPTSQKARVTQLAIEALTKPSTQKVRVTQLAVEVLINKDFRSLTANAILRRTQSASFTADARIDVIRMGSFTANAFLKALVHGWVTADAVIVKPAPGGSFTANAVIGRNLKADAVIRAPVSRSFTADAWIFAPAGSINPTPKVSIMVGGVDVTKDVVFTDAQFTMLVNGAVGNFRFRVRDRGHTYQFTSGAEVTVDIDGIRKFGGYLMQPSRMFAFPVEDTSVVTRVARFWVLTGVDYNILFAKRIVYNKVAPANVNLRSWPAGSQDDVVIKYVFDNYTDLAADGATHNGVTHIGSPNPDFAGVVASGSLSFGDAMREINRLLSGVFYFDPYKDLHFVDVDTADASSQLSDIPVIGAKSGYREFEHIENGAGLVNDALVWGAAAGISTLAFSRVQSTASQAIHGLWQYGEFSSQLYKQASVDKRADSIVNGTPQSKRGGKDDQVSWSATTWDTSFSVGQKVAIESHVWGQSDVVPIRRMTLTFPVKKKPKLQLVLSHEIDEPWNLFEFFFPRFGGFNITPIFLPKPGPFDVLRKHWYFGTFTYLTGDGAFPQGIASMVPPTSTVYSDNKAGALFQGGTDYIGAIGIITAGPDYAPQLGLLDFPVFPLGGGIGGLWSVSGFLGWGGLLHTGGAHGQFYRQQAASNISGPRDFTITINVTYWFDPIGWDIGTPAAGQQVINDFNNFGNGSQTHFFTTFPYQPGTLVVKVNDVVVAVTEINPATGEFALAVAPGAGVSIVAFYTAAGAASASFERGWVREDLPGSGTLIQLSSAYHKGSTQVFKNGYFQLPGGVEYAESDPVHGQLTFSSATTALDTITIIYEANGPP